MEEITKCSTVNCPYSSSCYRVLVESNPEYQVWYDYGWECNKESGFSSFQYVPKSNKQ